MDGTYIRRLTVAAVLVAVGVAVGYLMVAVPNVEGISAVSFFAGYHLGAAAGAAVGALAIGIFSLFNPLGPPLFQVLLGQIAGMALIGASGRLWGRLALRPRFGVILAVAFGITLTFLYGVLADYGTAVSIGKWSDPLPVIAAGIPLSVVHIVSNGLIFAALGAFLLRRKGN